jgi:MFS family permease
MIGRKGTFYLLQKNYPLVRWTVARFMLYSCSLAALVIALAYTFYIVPSYGLHLGELFVEFAVAIFIFLLSAAPLYMLRRFYTLALATGLALVVTLATAHLFTTSSSGFRHAQLLGIAVGSGAMVVIAASYLTMRSETRPGDDDSIAVVKPPELRVVLWHTAPYAVYGMAYFVMILVGPMIVGFAYGHSLGVDQYVYPSTFEGSVDLALLELVVLLGLVYALIERFGRRLRPLLENQTLDCWRQARTTLRREWLTAVTVLTVVSGVVAWLLPSILLALLPSGLTASVRTPGGLSVLEVASFGFAVVPIGMLCSQYLFFLSKPRAAVTGAVAGACTSALVTVLLVQGGDLTIASWGLLAGSIVYALITGLASYRALSAGEESFYGSF